MTHYLAYMQHYWETRKTPPHVVHGRGTKGNYLPEMIEQGDTLWIIVTGGPEYPEEWRLLQRIEVTQFYRLLKKWFRNIDIIHYREGLKDKLQYFTLYPVFVLIILF